MFFAKKSEKLTMTNLNRGKQVAKVVDGKIRFSFFERVYHF